MNVFFYTMLFLFGTLFGSFASVVIYRIKSGEAGIMTGRSHCGACNKILQALDLIPIVSYLKNKGKCNYCKKKVNSVYLFLELVSGILFTLIGYYLIDINLLITGNITEILKLFFYLSIAFLSIVYTFYDILFLEISERILASGIGFILVFLSLQTLIPGFHIIENLPNINLNLNVGIQAIILTLAIISGLYVIMTKELHELYDIGIVGFSIMALFVFGAVHQIDITTITILNGLIGALGIFIFFLTQILISRGKWMGGGDLRIALFIGLVLGTSLSFPALMLTYMIGSVLGIGFIIYSRIKKSGGNMNTQVPFGPFLALGFFCTLFFQTPIQKLIEIYF